MLGSTAVAGVVQTNTVVTGVFVVEVEPGTDTVGAALELCRGTAVV